MVKKKLNTVVNFEEQVEYEDNGNKPQPSVIKDEEVKRRDRVMFGNLLGHLKKAKTVLETQKQTLTKQHDNFEKIKTRETVNSGEFKEKQKADIEVKRDDELYRQLDNEKKLEQTDQELLLKRLERHYFNLTNFFVTKTEPKIFWKMVKQKPNQEGNILENKNSIQGIKDEHEKKTEIMFKQINDEHEKKKFEKIELEKTRKQEMTNRVNHTQENENGDLSMKDDEDDLEEDDDDKNHSRCDDEHSHNDVEIEDVLQGKRSSNNKVDDEDNDIEDEEEFD